MKRTVRMLAAACLVAASAAMLSGCLTALKKTNEFLMTTARIKADNESDFQKARAEPFLQEETGLEYDNVVGQTYLSGICSAFHQDPQKALATYKGKQILVKGLYQNVYGAYYLLFDGIMEMVEGSGYDFPTPSFNMVSFERPTEESVLYFMNKWKPGEIHSAFGAISSIFPANNSNSRCNIRLEYAFPEDDLASYISAKKHGREW